MKPYPAEIDEATLHPNGWVYRIVGDFRGADRVPAQAILGAWKVDAAGQIEGEFVPNPRYDPEKFPA